MVFSELSPVTFLMKEQTVLKKKVLPKPRTIGKIILFRLSLLSLLFQLRMKILFDLILEVSSCKIDFVKKEIEKTVNI